MDGGSRRKITRRIIRRDEGYAAPASSSARLATTQRPRRRRSVAVDPPPPQRRSAQSLLTTQSPWPHGAPTQRRMSRLNQQLQLPGPPRTAAQKRRDSAASDRARRYRDVEIIPGRTLADTIVVGQPARHFYTSLLVAFMTFTLGWSLLAAPRPPMLSFPAAVEMSDLLTPEEVDADGALWIDTAFRQGEAGDSGRKLLAAFAWVRAQYRGRHSPLLQSVAASVGTGRRAPGGTRLPLPEMMAKMLAVVMSGLGLQAGWSLDLGIAVMIGFHLYLRPGELLRLQ